MIELFTILIIILGLIFRKSRSLTLIMIVVSVILIGGSSFNADNYAYENNYFAVGNGLNNWKFEFGFQLINKLIFNLGFSYQQFRLIIALIGILLIYYTIKKFTRNTSYVMALYLIYPLVLDTIQIRNFLSMSVVIFGMQYIISHKKSYIKYFISILVATSIHATMAFYFAFLLLVLKNNRRMTFLVSTVSILSTILMPYIVKGLSMFIALEKINSYFFTKTSLLTQSGVYLYFLYSITIVKLLEHQLNNLDKSMMTTNINNDFYYESEINDKSSFLKIDQKAIVSINIISLLSLPLVINNLNFFRLYRNVFIINYIFYAFYLERNRRTYNSLVFQILIISLVLGSFVLLIYFVPQTNIIAPVFKNNIFFAK